MTLWQQICFTDETAIVRMSEGKRSLNEGHFGEYITNDVDLPGLEIYDYGVRIIFS